MRRHSLLLLAAAAVSAAVLASASAVFGAAATGGNNIASAPTIVPGQQEFGNTGDGKYVIGCARLGSFWKIPLVAGDHLTVDWESTGNYVQWLNIWPANTNDFSINNTSPTGVFQVGNNGKAESLFIPNESGIYPIIFDSCIQNGPFDFVASLQHAAVVFLPALSHVSLRGSRIVVGAHAPDGTPISDPKLRLTLSGIWAKRFHKLATVSPVGGKATFALSLPPATRGKVIKLRVDAGGPTYLPSHVARSVLVK